MIYGMATDNYTRFVKVTKVVDGDTVHCNIDMGMDIYTNCTIRLAGIDAPELGTDAGKETRDWLKSQVPADKIMVLRTVKDKREKYGRYLGYLYAVGSDVSLNQKMIELGLVAPYDGGKR